MGNIYHDVKLTVGGYPHVCDTFFECERGSRGVGKFHKNPKISGNFSKINGNLNIVYFLF